MRVKVEDHKNLERDVNTKAVINTDSLAYYENKKKRKAAKEQAERLNNLEANVERLNITMENILSKLDQIIQR